MLIAVTLDFLERTRQMLLLAGAQLFLQGCGDGCDLVGVWGWVPVRGVVMGVTC